MRTHVESIEIAAPPEQAHAFLADPEKLPVWARIVRRAAKPGPA